MSDSETLHSIKYQNSKGENLLDNENNKKLTSDTEYYFNLIANPSKMIKNKNTTSSQSDLQEFINNSDSDTDKLSKNSIVSSYTNHNNDNLNLLDQLSDNPKQDSKQIYETINLNTNPYKKPISPVTQFISPDIKLQETKNVIISNEIKENPLSPQEIRMKKIELLRKLSEIKVKGYQLSKDYDFNSQLEEMEYEYALLRSFVDKRNGVKIFKNSLLQFVSVVEFLNDKYDPFDFQLSGWSEHLTIEVDNWEDVMEELYEKYKGKGRKMAPEIKLLYLIIASASAFHFSKSYASKLPGLDSILSSNPGLLNKIINGNSKESSQFMTPQELNIEKQKEKIKKNEIDNKNHILQQQNYIKELQHKMQQQQNFIETIAQNQNKNTDYRNNFENTNNQEPSIKAPENVKDILNRIHTLSGTIRSNADTQDEVSSNNDRLISETTLSENPKRKYQKKNKKANIVIT
jgi:hypothetical protein